MMNESIPAQSDAAAAPERRTSERRPYVKPACQAIPLVAEEVLGVGCKFVGGTGQLGDCHLGEGCPSEGS